MELHDAIRDRRSCRKFRPEPVSAETLRSLVLEGGIWAPTGGNAQAWRFGLVTDPAVIEDIAMVSPGMPHNPPALVVICQDSAVARWKSRDFGNEEYAVMDTAMAAQNIMLLAHASGLGTCAVASFHRGGVTAALNLPEQIVPQLLIAIGRPERIPAAPARNTEVCWENRYEK